MGVLIMTNAQMGTPSLGRNGNLSLDYSWKQHPQCGILNSQNSVLGVGLKTQNVKRIRIFVFRKLHFGTISAKLKEETDKQLVGGGVMEKEFEFKPSFSEYLKAMQSVKTGRVSKQDNKSNRCSPKDGSRGKDELPMSSSGRDDENVQLRKFEGNLDETISKAVELQEFCTNGDEVSQCKRVLGGKYDGKRSVTRKSKDKLNGNERHVYMKVKTKSERETRDGRGLHRQNNRVEPKFKDVYLTKGTKFQNAQDSSMVSVDDQKSGSTVNSRSNYVHDRSSSEELQIKGKSFREEVGDRSRETRGSTNVMDFGKIRKISPEKQKSQKAIGSRNFFLEEDDDNIWELERAAFKTFEEGNDIMDKRRVPKAEMEGRIQKLAGRLNGADISLPEWIFSKMMRSAQIKYSDHSIMRVIQILGKLGNWRRVLQVIEWLQRRERFKPHRLKKIYTTALNVLGKARRPVEALNVFHAMQQQMSSYPDIVAYRCIAVTLGQAGHLKELFDVIDSMQSLPKNKLNTGVLERWDPRLEPDIVVYNAVLNACVKRKQFEGAFWVLQQLKKQGQKPSATTYGLVMEVMLACGNYNLVHEFFSKLQKSHIPNALAYKVVVNSLWREGKIDDAVSAVQDMEKQGIVGSAALYYDLARCLCSAGRCQESLMQIEKICKVANKPLVVTYTGLIQACLDSGNIQNAAYIFNQMKDFCSPNLVTCNIMLKAYLDHGLFKEAMQLFQKMSEDSNRITREYDNKDLVIPDIYTFKTMLDACFSEKRWDDLEHVYRRMLHHGLHFNTKCHLQMILDASRAGKVELVEITWKHLAQADQVPPSPLIKERFCTKLENRDYISALSCVTSHPISHLPEFSRNAWLKLFKDNYKRFGEDTLISLIRKANSTLPGGNDSPASVLQNVISSCKEILTCGPTPEMNMTQTPWYSSI